MTPADILMRLGVLALIAAAIYFGASWLEDTVKGKALAEQKVANLQVLLDDADEQAKLEKVRAKKLDDEAITLASERDAALKSKARTEREMADLKKRDPAVAQWAGTRIPDAEFNRLCDIEASTGHSGEGACRDRAKVVPPTGPGRAPPRADERRPGAPAQRSPGGGEGGQRPTREDRQVERRGSEPFRKVSAGAFRTSGVDQANVVSAAQGKSQAVLNQEGR